MSRTGSTTRDRSPGGRRPAGRPGPRAPRQPERRPPRRTARSRRWLRIALALTAVGAVGWLLWLGPVLAVRTVQVDGATRLSADEVRTVARVPAGEPLLRVDLDAVEDRVARLPQVRDVQAARSWPDRIVVTVAERVPIAVVGAPGRRSLVDSAGVLFDTVTGDLPRGVVSLEVGDAGPDDPDTLAGLAAIRALPAAVREDVSEVAVPEPDDITLTMVDGTVVRWGDADRSQTKGAVLVALLERMRDGELEAASLVDVSAPGAVVLR